MVSAATQSPPRAQSGGKPGAGPRPAVPFIRASAKHIEAPFYDTTFTIGATQQDIGVIEVPAYGYVRAILLLVTTSGFTSAAPSAFQEDGPFNVLQNIQFNEPNGAQIAQFGDGYELMLANKFGGYQGPGLSNDPRANPLFAQQTATGANSGSFQFLLRIPVELDCRSGLGSLPNQAANATFRVRAAIAPTSTVYTTAPTTPGQVRLRMMVETWDQPEVASGGVSNQVTPPAMNTTQFWSRQVYNLGAGGNQTIRLNRVGNYLRELIFILRSGASGAQGAGQRFNAQTLYTNTTPAGQVFIYLDSRPTEVINDDVWRARMWEKSGGYGGGIAAQLTAGAATPNAADQPYGQENGVRVLDYCTEFDNNYGRENRDLWQPTLGSTRLEIQSPFGALTNGTLTVLTNDVALAGNVFL